MAVRQWGNDSLLHDDLCYIDAWQKIALPGWSWWMIKLGQWLSNEHKLSDKHGTGQVVRIVTSVPHRGYAAVLVAVGVVVDSCARKAIRDVNEHLKYLQTVPLNTPVKYREASGNKVSYRKLLGFEDRYICLSGGYKRATNQCSFIEPLPPDCPPFRVREICDRPDFICAATKLDPYEHGFRQTAECALVGIKADIVEELELELSAGNSIGSFQDLIRVCEHMKHPSDGYRCHLVSAVAEPGEVTSLEDNVGPVIFDGANAFLRWHHTARDRSWLAVLDRTAASADPARDAIIADRAMSVEDLTLPLGDTPAGIEVLCYAKSVA